MARAVRTKPGDQFGSWLLAKILEQYPNIHQFSKTMQKKDKGNRNIPPVDYLSKIIRVPTQPVGKNFLKKMCEALGIEDTEAAQGLALLNDRKVNILNNRRREPNYLRPIPIGLLQSLAKMVEEGKCDVTCEDIGNIIEILTRLGDEYIDKEIVQQITEKYFVLKQQKSTSRIGD